MKYLFILLVFCLVGCKDENEEYRKQYDWSTKRCVDFCTSQNQYVEEIRPSGGCKCGREKEKCKK